MQMTSDMDSDSDLDEDKKGFDLFAKFSLAINSLTEEFKAHRKAEQKRMADLPRSFSQPYSIQLNSSGQGIVAVGGPQPGREWIVREVTAVHSTYQFVNPTGNAAIGAAGAAVTASLPGGACVVTGFDVSIQEATAAGVATITLSNVPGGPYTYYLEESTSAAQFLSKSLNLPTSSSPTLTVSAVTNGGIVSANLYGTLDVNPVDVTWYKGQPILSTTVLPQDMAFGRIHMTPGELTYTSDVVRILQNEQLIVGAINGPANAIITGMYKILDQPAFSERQRVAAQ